jgi:L-lysine exporter family protein LysE/ArgO
MTGESLAATTTGFALGLTLVGAVGAQHAGPARLWFVVGSAGASVLWFSSLGYGARLPAPVFARPRAWQWLDGAIRLTMWVLALLLRHAFGGSGG